MSILASVCSMDVCIAVYFAYIYSVLKYGIIIWGTSTDFGKLFIAQKAIIRTLTHSSRRTSCRQLFRKLNILTLPSIYILEILITVYRNPQLFNKYLPAHNYSTRHNKLFQFPIHSFKKFESSPLYMGLKIYNKIPTSFKNLSEKNFYSSIKEILIKKAYYSIEEFLNDDNFSV